MAFAIALMCSFQFRGALSPLVKQGDSFLRIVTQTYYMKHIEKYATMLFSDGCETCKIGKESL